MTSKKYVKVGEVNYDVWRWMSGYLVDDMRLWWNFPKYPEVRIAAYTCTYMYLCTCTCLPICE